MFVPNKLYCNIGERPYGLCTFIIKKKKHTFSDGLLLLFFNFVQKIIPKFKNCNSEKQFLDLLSTDNEIILKKLVQFIYNNFKKRSPFLDKLDEGGLKNGRRTLKIFWEDWYAREISRFVCNKVRLF